jgi:UDP-glucose 4-epimerase
MVNEITCSKAGVEHKPMRRGEVPTQIVATGSNWHKLRGWRPQFSHDQMRETVAWYLP